MSDVDRRWGREVGPAVVGGREGLVYTVRPRAVGELLLDTRRWGDRELLVQGARRFSRPQHERAVARAAAQLRAEGVRRGDRVLLLGDNSIEWVVTFWALQTLGAVAALGNAWWSEPEVADAVALLEPALAVTDRPTAGVRTVALASMGVGDEDVDLVLTEVDEEDPALIMFSSGTTGAAKGVVMPHRSVVANIHNLLVLTGRLPDELSAEHPGTVGLLSVPLFHLAGIQTSITTLLSGGRLVFLEGRFDAGEVLDLIERERVRVWGAIPTMVSRVLDHPSFAEHDTSSVSSIPLGGAAVSPELRERIAAAFTGVRSRVGSLYGLTEAGGVLAAGSGRDVAGRPGCVGRPLPVVEIRIVRPAADGTGEIQARTPTVSAGYLGEPDGIADPDGWIASGDLGRVDEEGYLYVTGRSKDVIIRGGENIASAHVERALLSHPAVAEAAVVALPHDDLGEEVADAVVPHGGAEIHVDDLTRHLRERLGRFEIPTRWWVRDEPLPTTPSGKVLRREVRDHWPAGA